MQSTSWETLGWEKRKLESRLPGEISITSDMQMTPPLGQKVKRNSKASWWKWKRRVKHLENEDHGIWPHQFMGNSVTLNFWGLQNHCRWWLQPWNFKMLAPWKKSYDQSRQHIKKRRHYFANKGPSSQSSGFSSSHVWMWELASKEGWALKNWCFWTVVLEKTLESPLDWKEIKPV